MESLPDIFFRMANARFAKHPDLNFSWCGPEKDGKRTLIIPKKEDNGFDIRIECEVYGLYPYAGDWHGAPWDITTPTFTMESMCEDCLGFVRSLLCSDSRLIVYYTNDSPYRWILSYPLGDSITNDKTGLVFYNYFGRRRQHVFQNHHMPPQGSTPAT